MYKEFLLQVTKAADRFLARAEELKAYVDANPDTLTPDEKQEIADELNAIRGKLESFAVPKKTAPAKTKKAKQPKASKKR